MHAMQHLRTLDMVSSAKGTYRIDEVATMLSPSHQLLTSKPPRVKVPESKLGLVETPGTPQIGAGGKVELRDDWQRGVKADQSKQTRSPWPSRGS
jgi:hypothetical protein